MCGGVFSPCPGNSTRKEKKRQNQAGRRILSPLASRPDTGTLRPRRPLRPGSRPNHAFLLSSRKQTEHACPGLPAEGQDPSRATCTPAAAAVAGRPPARQVRPSGLLAQEHGRRAGFTAGRVFWVGGSQRSRSFLGSSSFSLKKGGLRGHSAVTWPEAGERPSGPSPRPHGGWRPRPAPAQCPRAVHAAALHVRVGTQASCSLCRSPSEPESI